MHITQIESIKTASAPSLGVPDAAMSDPAELLDRYFEQALGLHEAGQWQQAESLYLKMLAVDARQPAVNYNLGMLKWQTNAHTSSLDFFQRALAADNSNPEYWITYVDALIQTGQHAHARETLMRGLEHGLQGEEVDALVNQLAKPLVANSVVTPTVALVIDTQANQQDVAQKTLSQNGHEKIDVKNDPAKNNHGKTSANKKHTANNPKIRQAFDLMQAGKLEQAKVKFKYLLKFYPTHPLIMSGLGSIAMQQGNIDAGVQWLEQSLKYDEAQTTALSVLSIAYAQQKRLDEAVRCCDRAIAINPNYAEAHTNRANALRDLRRYNEAATSYQQAITLNPRDVDNYFNLASINFELKQYLQAEEVLKRGFSINSNDIAAQSLYAQILHKLKKSEAALAIYKKIIVKDPGHFNAFMFRGLIFLEQKQFESALDDFKTATQLNPQHDEAFRNLAVAQHRLGLIDEAMSASAMALKLNKGNKITLANHGLYLAGQHQFGQALAFYNQAIAADPSYYEAYWNKSLLLLLTGDFEQAWPLYEYRWKREGMALRQFAKPLWLGKAPLTNKTLLIYHEQGLGDTIQFCRYANKVLALGAKVIIEAPKALLNVLKTLKGNFVFIEAGAALPHFDFHCPMMSLPLAFKTSLDSIPAQPSYLAADEVKQQQWQQKLGIKTLPRIGLVWSGATMHKNDHLRSIPLETLKRILTAPIEFHSLQKEIRESDALLLNNMGSLHTHTEELTDFTDTAALIAQMDMVISVDTSVAHLAAAMGKPCWILLPYAPDFRWLLERDDSPWYPSVKLFRQSEFNDWSSVVDQLKRGLANF